MLLAHISASLSRCISLHVALQVYMSNSGPKKYHWTDVQLYALGLAGQNASNQEKTTDVQLGMEIASNYKMHLQHALADMLVSWDDVHTYSMDDLVLVRTALAPVTLWNKFKDLQKKGKCLSGHYNTWSLLGGGKVPSGTQLEEAISFVKDKAWAQEQSEAALKKKSEAWAPPFPALVYLEADGVEGIVHAGGEEA